MTIKRPVLIRFLIVSGVLGALFLMTASANTNATLYQTGTFSALTNGVLDGSTTISDLHQLGDMGLGTINDFYGEMIMLDGNTYLSDHTGRAHLVAASSKTPFAQVVRFQSDQQFVLKKVPSFKALIQAINAHLPSRNNFYAIKITGHFKVIQFRAVDQGTPPYVPYPQWLEHHQHILYQRDVDATVVGFITPAYTNDLTMAGYHLHFISRDKKIMGHVYDLAFDEATVQLETLQQFHLIIPSSKQYQEADLTPASEATIQKMQTARAVSDS